MSATKRALEAEIADYHGLSTTRLVQTRTYDATKSEEKAALRFMEKLGLNVNDVVEVRVGADPAAPNGGVRITVVGVRRH